MLKHKKIFGEDYYFEDDEWGGTDNKVYGFFILIFWIGMIIALIDFIVFQFNGHGLL